MIEYFLQGDYILGFTVEVVSKSLPHSVGSNVFNPEYLGHIPQNHVGPFSADCLKAVLLAANKALIVLLVKPILLVELLKDRIDFDDPLFTRFLLPKVDAVLIGNITDFELKNIRNPEASIKASHEHDIIPFIALL